MTEYERAVRLAEVYVAPVLERAGLGYDDARETARHLAPLVRSIAASMLDKNDAEVGAFLARHYGGGDK